MGALGPKIADEDLAADVQARFRDLATELSGAKATTRVISEYQDTLQGSDDSDARVFWLALADIAWRTGNLQAEVKKRALAIIEEGLDLERWPEALRDERQQVLDDLRTRLESRPPKRKRLSKPFRDHNEWQAGEIIAYRRSSGQRILFRVLGSYEDNGTWTEKGETSPLIEILDWQGEEIPSASGIAQIGVRKDRTHDHFVRAVLFRHSQKDRRSSRFESTGLRVDRPQDLAEVTRLGVRKLLVALAMVPRMEVPNSTCRALHVRSLDKDLEELYGF